MSRNIHVIYKASCNTGTGDINEKRVIILNEKNISKIYLRKMFSYMKLQWLIKVESIISSHDEASFT